MDPGQDSTACPGQAALRHERAILRKNLFLSTGILLLFSSSLEVPHDQAGRFLELVDATLCEVHCMAPSAYASGSKAKPNSAAG